MEIKDISEMCQEEKEVLEKIILDYHDFLDSLPFQVEQLQNLKKQEEEKTINLYDSIINYLEDKKKEDLEKINTFANENSEKLMELQSSITNRLEIAENLKLAYEDVRNTPNSYFFEVNDNYRSFLNEISSEGDISLDLKKFKLTNEDPNKLSMYLDKFSDIKTSQHYIILNYKNFSLSKRGSNNRSYKPNQLNPGTQANKQVYHTKMQSEGKRTPYEDTSSDHNQSITNKLKHQSMQVNEVLDTSEYAREYENKNQLRESYREKDKIGQDRYEKSNRYDVDESIDKPNMDYQQRGNEYSTEFKNSVNKLKKDLSKYENNEFLNSEPRSKQNPPKNSKITINIY